MISFLCLTIPADMIRKELIQKMNFQEGDDGPFWMSAEEKEKSKQDQPSGKIKKT